ncbi:MAG: hypothetical protein ACD_73C00564G0001 [uncultured bacterium]|nr:MAG: hypothetical protein ACD_73C00564G0001 [uncultured bacterium]
MENESPLQEFVNEYSLAEFAGKFGYTTEKALFEIKKHNVRAGNWCEQEGIGFNVGKVEYIPKAEVDRYAAIIAAEDQDNDPPQKPLPLYMKKRHPAFTSELEAAVSCWMALFADAPPGKVATHTKDKTITWLEQNRPKLDDSQRKRIATVLTPNSKKKGGAPTTPE